MATNNLGHLKNLPTILCLERNAEHVLSWTESAVTVRQLSRQTVLRGRGIREVHQLQEDEKLAASPPERSVFTNS